MLSSEFSSYPEAENNQAVRGNPPTTAREGARWRGSRLQGHGGPGSWAGVSVCGALPLHSFGEGLPSNRDPSVVVVQSFDLRSIVSQ